jgi:hypothetical protein
VRVCTWNTAEKQKDEENTEEEKDVNEEKEP